MKRHTFSHAFSAAVLIAALLVLPVSADDGPTGGDGEGDTTGGEEGGPTGIGWENDPGLVNQVVNPDGSINYAGMTDLGVVSEPADWMAGVPYSDGMATYHQYMSPDGSLVLVPTGLTTIGLQWGGGLYEQGFPDGYYNPLAVIGTFLSDTIAANLGYSAALFEGGAEISLPNSAGYYSSSSDTLTIDQLNIIFDTLADYQGIAKDNLLDQLMMSGRSVWNLLTQGATDGNGILANLGTTILIYPDCTQSPVGCTDDYIAAHTAAMPPAAVVVDPPSCAAPYTTTGPITVTGGPGAGDGGKLAPLHPVVVGQDPQRRGVDIQAQVLVPLITYHYFESVRHEELLCLSGPANSGNHGCPGPASNYANGASWTRSAIWNNKNYEQVHIYFECIEHTRTYTDYVRAATINLSLTEESRQWILTSLEQAYPGAHLKHPSFSFSYPGPGSLAGNSVFWTKTITSIPVEDPGWWAVTVNVLTTGTPVSGARFVTVPIGQFLDELVRVTLTSGSQP